MLDKHDEYVNVVNGRLCCINSVYRFRCIGSGKHEFTVLAKFLFLSGEICVVSLVNLLGVQIVGGDVDKIAGSILSAKSMDFVVLV